MNHDPLDLDGQASAEELQAHRDDLAAEKERATFKWLMSSKKGRSHVWSGLDRAGVFRSSFNTNALAMAFAEGARNEGLRTIAMIHQVCPELYAVLVKENTSDADDGTRKQTN